MWRLSLKMKTFLLTLLVGKSLETSVDNKNKKKARQILLQLIYQLLP